MSVFDQEILAGEAVMFDDAGDLADYQGEAGMLSGIRVVLDRDWEVYDQDQLAMRVTTISVRVADVSVSRQGDRIVLPGRTWSIQEILEDDGHVRRLWVT